MIVGVLLGIIISILGFLVVYFVGRASSLAKQILPMAKENVLLLQRVKELEVMKQPMTINFTDEQLHKLASMINGVRPASSFSDKLN